MPKISIISGIFNCADTLPAAIDSIICQTFADWEWIMCDDGSTDNTYAVAERFCSKYPKKMFLLKNSKNMGLNYTLNRCLQVAQGEYIARMDGDDISLPERFEKEVAALDASPSLAVVSCPMVYFDEKGDWGKGNLSNVWPKSEQLVHGTVHCHAPCMLRANVMRQVGGYSEEKRLLRVEDWHLWIKIYATGAQGMNLPEYLYKMRDDRNAMGRRKFKFRFNEAYVSALAVKTFHLPKWKYIYALRPIIVGLLPKPIYITLHRKKLEAQR